MLRELYIQNFVLLEKANLHFPPDFIVFSGETGAGKSMLLESLRFLLGARAKSDHLGPYGDKTVVVGVFELSEPLAQLLQGEMGIEIEEGELAIKREMLANKKSRAYVNGVPTSSAVLKKLAHHFMDIHSQDDQRTLLSPAFHRQMVDDYGGWKDLLESYTSLFDQYQRVIHQLAQLEEKEKNRQDRLEFLEFQLAELGELNLKKGEKKELTLLYNRISHSAEIGEMAEKWLNVFVESDNSPLNFLGQAIQEGQDFIAFDRRFKEVEEVAEEAVVLINQLGHLFQEIGSQSQWDPRELQELEERLVYIESMEKKYHCSADELVARKKDMDGEKKALLSLEDDKEELCQKIKQMRKNLEDRGQKLRAARKKGAPKLAKNIEKELKILGMKGAVFQVDFQPLPSESLGPRGMDQVEFLVSPNPGIFPKPLGEVSSGGERSRIMLALKGILSEKYAIPILFFDEIDGNIGGRMGHVVGERLYKLAKAHQVFCITHLPQIAALGQGHFKIEKKIHHKLTRTVIYPIKGEKRTAEIAEMMEGQKFSSTALAQARELLNQSKKNLPR